LVRKEELDSELDREFAFHLDHLIQENIDRGMRPEDATRAARRVLGNATVLQGICRDERRVSWLQDVAQDLRYGVRMLRKNPSFTFVAAISLALGIGANTAILSAIDSVMRGSLPYADPDRLVMIRTYRFQNPGQLGSVSLPDYFAWKQENHSFESIGASLANQSDLDSDDDGSSPEHLIGKLFSPELFPTLGVQPLIGRVFSETDFRPGQPPSVVLISHDLWQRRFGGDRQILNQRLRLNGQPVSVIGVMPQYFPYSEEKVDYWLPMTLVRPTENTARVFIVTARLKSGVSLQQAQADLSSIAEDLAVDFPERNNGWGVRVQPLREFLYGWTKPALLTLETAIVLVLLIACANVAGLLLARGAARAPEIAMRVALGAGRWRIIRQLLTESVLLAFVGGTLGLVVCRWGLSGIASMVPPPGAPRLAEFTITFRMLGIAAITSLITGLGFGLVPVVATFKSDLARPSVSRAGGALIAGQLAIAFVLLIGFGLLTNSFLRLASRDFNFDSKGLLTFDFRIPQQSYMHDIGSYRDARYFEINPNPALVLQRLYERLRQLPGAVSVAGTSHQPVNSLIVPSAKVVPENLQTSNGVPVANAPTTSYFLVTPNFFATLRSPLMRGRDFDDHDTASTP
jgi:predicted permease